MGGNQEWDAQLTEPPSVTVGQSLTMAHGSALVQKTQEIMGLALGSSEGRILKEQVLMGLEEERVGRGLQNMGSSVREVEGIKMGMEIMKMVEGRTKPQKHFLSFFPLPVCLS